MVLPNLVIAGAPKSGTSSLFRWLCDHPEVLGSSVKETRYFADPGTHVFDEGRNYLSRGLEGYSEFFKAKGPEPGLVVEATPTYLYSELALRELPLIPSKPHFQFVLRDPVSQVRSVHRYFQQNWAWVPPDMDFRSFVAASRAGNARFDGNELAEGVMQNAAYVDFLVRWRDACKPQRMHVFLFEDVFADPRAFMRELARRFGIEPTFYDDYPFPAENQTYTVRNRLLQKLNIAVRPMIPQGALYRAARSVYRLLNTSREDERNRGNAAVEEELREGFRLKNEALAREFDLDLTPWGLPRGGNRGRRAGTLDLAHVNR